MNKYLKFCQLIDYQFKNIDWLKLALTHRSANPEHNERLEFIGDSIVNLVIAEALYKANPSQAEGELSRWRAALVQRETLFEIGQEWQLAKLIEVGPGEKKMGGQNRPAAIANAVEAIFGAIYFDSNFETIQKIILKIYENRLKHHHQIQKDAKTLLQEWLQSKHLPLPQYELIKTEGEEHQSTFHIRCQLNNGQCSIGIGSSKRRAEQDAALKLYEKIKSF